MCLFLFHWSSLTSRDIFSRSSASTDMTILLNLGWPLSTGVLTKFFYEVIHFLFYKSGMNPTVFKDPCPRLVPTSVCLPFDPVHLQKKKVRFLVPVLAPKLRRNPHRTVQGSPPLSTVLRPHLLGGVSVATMTTFTQPQLHRAVQIPSAVLSSTKWLQNLNSVSSF